MSNGDLITALSKLHTIESSDGQDYVQMYDVLETVKRYSAKEDIAEWISVSERLPEEDGCYLVTTTGTNNDIIDIAYYTDGIWHKASRIKAWMPLPKPYKAESEEEE